VDSLQDILQHKDSTDASLVLLSEHLQAVRIPMLHAQELAAAGQPILNTRAMLSLHSGTWAGPGDDLLILSNQGRGFKRLLTDISPLSDNGRWPDAPDEEWVPGERPAALLAASRPPRFWTVVTRRGYVQRLVRVACDQKIARAEPLFKSPVRRDEPVAVVSGDKKDILLITRWGKAVRFAQRAIETQGSIALDLDPGDQVVAAVALELEDAKDSTESEILIVTASGYGMRRNSRDVQARMRPGGTGKTLIQAHDVLAAFYTLGTSPGAELFFVTYGGNLVVAPTHAMPLHERLSKGTLLSDLGQDPAIAVTLTR
jgi:DNA gyrase/topoisomerase IV subunit A